MNDHVLLLDCDVSGHRSVLDYVKAGKIVAYPCKSFQDTETVFWALYRRQIPLPKLIIVDTITALAEKTRQDVVLDPEKKGATGIWELGDAVVANKREWGIAGDYVNRLLRNIVELDIPSIFVAHEGERDDVMSGVAKMTPNLQKMILGNVVANADAIVRLRPSPLPLVDAAGNTFPPGTRQLLLRPTGDSSVGVRAVRPLPEYLIEPTLEDFAQALGGWEYFPHNLLVYGPPKTGKTTFATGVNRRNNSAAAV